MVSPRDFTVELGLEKQFRCRDTDAYEWDSSSRTFVENGNSGFNCIMACTECNENSFKEPPSPVITDEVEMAHNKFIKSTILN